MLYLSTRCQFTALLKSFIPAVHRVSILPLTTCLQAFEFVRTLAGSGRHARALADHTFQSIKRAEVRDAASPGKDAGAAARARGWGGGVAAGSGAGVPWLGGATGDVE